MEQIKKNFGFGCMRLPMNGENIRLFFESQLAACGTEYFDFYLMHAQGAGNYPHFKACHAYETAFAPRPQGVRLRQVRTVREGLSPAPAHPPSSGGRGKKI